MNKDSFKADFIVVLSIGSEGDFTREQIQHEIKIGSEIGMQLIESNMALLRSFKDGSFIKLIAPN